MFGQSQMAGTHHNSIGGSGNNAFPAYIVEKREKMREQVEMAETVQFHNADVRFGKMQGFSADLRMCCEMVEGSVLSLGVPTAHTLITKISGVREGIDEASDAWRFVQSAKRDVVKQHEELIDSINCCYAALKERNESLEREVRMLVSERDSRETALDGAVQYVQSVVAERAAWQQQHGFNKCQLPLEEESFAERCSNALRELYAARRVDASSADNAATTLCAHLPITHLPPLGSSPATATTAVTSNFHSSGKATGAPQKQYTVAEHTYERIPIGRPFISSVDDVATVRKRWNTLENTRHSAVIPSSRLRYVPPTEDIEMLREVLAMGTGSSILMKDIKDAKAHLELLKSVVLKNCIANMEAVKKLKRELVTFKEYIKDMLSRGLPFVAFKTEFLQLAHEQLEREAVKAARVWSSQQTSVGNSMGDAPEFRTQRRTSNANNKRPEHPSTRRSTNNPSMCADLHAVYAINGATASASGASKSFCDDLGSFLDEEESDEEYDDTIEVKEGY